MILTKIKRGFRLRIKDIINRIFVDKTDSTFIQFFRSLFVGGVATVVDMGALALMVEFFGIDKVFASVAAFIIGLGVNFILSSFWVFKKAKVNSKTVEFVIFSIIAVIGLFLNTLIIYLFDAYVSGYAIFGSFIPSDKYYLIGKIAATIIVFIWNFFARKYFIYNSNSSDN